MVSPKQKVNEMFNDSGKMLLKTKQGVFKDLYQETEWWPNILE